MRKTSGADFDAELLILYCTIYSSTLHIIQHVGHYSINNYYYLARSKDIAEVASETGRHSMWLRIGGVAREVMIRNTKIQL